MSLSFRKDKSDLTDLLTVEQVAELLHCKRFTVDRLIAEGALRYLPIGKRNLVPRSDVQSYVETHLKVEGRR